MENIDITSSLVLVKLIHADFWRWNIKMELKKLKMKSVTCGIGLGNLDDGENRKERC